jgi:hypothetical protein
MSTPAAFNYRKEKGSVKRNLDFLGHHSYHSHLEGSAAMAIHIMPGVSFDKLSPQALLGLIITDQCFSECGEDCIVTSCYREGTWVQTLLHGRGHAFDVAVRDLAGKPIPEEVIVKILDRITTRIGKSRGGMFDVLYEASPDASVGWTGAHIHIEFDPISGAAKATSQNA